MKPPDTLHFPVPNRRRRLRSVICPYCGHESGHQIPYSATEEKIADCPSCDSPVYSVSSDGDGESQAANVREGERDEEWAADLVVEQTGIADYHENRGQFDDIDRALYEEGRDAPVAFMEFKNRSNTLNGYYKTMFPHRKVVEAKELVAEHGVPVYIVLKFADAWAVHSVDENREYPREDWQFTPNDAASDRTAEKQHPTMIPVTELSRLPFRDGCLDAEKIRGELLP